MGQSRQNNQLPSNFLSHLVDYQQSGTSSRVSPMTAKGGRRWAGSHRRRGAELWMRSSKSLHKPQKWALGAAAQHLSIH